MPGYLQLSLEELDRRVQEAQAMLAGCRVCPRRCGARRLSGEAGYCRGRTLPAVVSCCEHHGEEPVLSGTRGAGTVFFPGCSLRCIYCQNHEISQCTDISRYELSPAVLADRFVELQARGCHNIELVSPSHYVPQILEALKIARSKELALPLVYNTNGYDSLEMLRLLDGVVDIYLPDLKYGQAEQAGRFSDAEDYVEVARRAIREMWRQVGPLVLDENGIAQRGLIVRHLVLPSGVSGTRECLRFLAEEVSGDVTVSLMSQYYPVSEAVGSQVLGRPINIEEYDRALEALDEFSLELGWVQELDSEACFRPDFSRSHPFEKRD